MKCLIMVVTSKTHNHGDILNIDRVDLTRKLDAINTWVEEVINRGHEVVFFDGGNEEQYYDESSLTLHLTEDDRYEENGVPSRLLKKIQKAFEWAIKNKQFDYVYICDDDVYINSEQFFKKEITHDFMSAGAFGGAGYFLTKKAMEVLCEYKNYHFSVCDLAMYSILSQNDSITKFYENKDHSIFYFPGELYSTVHYVTGKRSYFFQNVLRFYKENGYTNRKIILGGPLDSYKENIAVTYESSIKRKTKRWYDFTVDPNGWEYHGGYPRSSVHLNHLKSFWPYAENSAKYFVVNFDKFLGDYKDDKKAYLENMEYLIEKCEYSLINKNNIILLTEDGRDIEGWVKQNNLKKDLNLDFEVLSSCNFYLKK